MGTIVTGPVAIVAAPAGKYPAERLQRREKLSIIVGGTCMENVVRFSARRRRTTLLAALVIVYIFGASSSLEARDTPVRDFFAQSDLVMLLIDPDSGAILDANAAALQFYRHSRREITAMAIQDLNLLSPAQVEEEFRTAAREERSFFIFRHQIGDGTVRTVEVVSQPITVDGKQMLLSVIRDATDYRFHERDLWYYQSLLESQVDTQTGHIRMLQQRTLWISGTLIVLLLIAVIYLARTVRNLRAAEESLLHSNTILREVHHRIKNNMSTVVGLLQIEARKVRDPAAQEALRDTRGRVIGMMQLYEILYRSTNFQSVPMDKYIPDLVNQIVSHFPNREQVSVHTPVEPFELDGSIVSSLGVAITELVTNSMKYAFPRGRTGTITVSATANGTGCTVTVADDGPGLPAGTDTATGHSGLGLVHLLAQQMKAEISVESSSDSGTVVTIAIDQV